MRSHIRFLAFVLAAVAFGTMSMNLQTAHAEPRPGVVSSKASADLRSKDRDRVSRAHHRTAAKHAAAPAPTAGTSTEPVFLSDAWLQQEKRTDDRLKRFMNICKGC